MPPIKIRKEIADRVLQRRGRYHLFDGLDPARTALLAIDMQDAFPPAASRKYRHATALAEPT